MSLKLTEEEERIGGDWVMLGEVACKIILLFKIESLNQNWKWIFLFYLDGHDVHPVKVNIELQNQDTRI